MQVTLNPIRWLYLILAVFTLILICLLIPNLYSRFYTQQAYTDLRRDELAQARIDLDKAKGWAGYLSSANDAKRLELAEGDLFIRQAETAKSVTLFLEEMEKAEKHFAAAVDLDPFDIDGYIGLARSTAALEKIYPFVHRRSYPKDALPVFENLKNLMPVNLYTFTLLAQYYLSKQMTAELYEAVGSSIRLYPPLYYQLRDQPFYSLAMNEMLKKSLLAAIENGVYVESAYRVLSDLALQEEDYRGAVDYYRKTRTVTPYKDNSGHDLRLGALYLRAGQFDAAEQSFVESMNSPDRERRLQEIWKLYKNSRAFNEFLIFCKRVDATNIVDLIEILQAKCLIGMNQNELAVSHLLRVGSHEYAAESLYLQAHIAEKKKDWDTMELRSQRATVLEPGNRNYHLLFSQALKKQKKWPQAERAASEAINNSTDPEAWLYNNRAWIRWTMKDYPGAQEDWQQAIGISPDEPWSHYGMALAFEQGGNIDAAIRQLDLAMTLKPGESVFIKKYNELMHKTLH